MLGRDFSYADGDPADWRMAPNAYPRLVWQKGYSGGSGTAEDPYTISTVADWQELIGTSDDWDKHFNLLNDIDFEGINLTPIAPDTDPVREDHQGTPFTGTFEGKDHSIRHCRIQAQKRLCRNIRLYWFRRRDSECGYAGCQYQRGGMVHWWPCRNQLGGDIQLFYNRNGIRTTFRRWIGRIQYRNHHFLLFRGFRF